MCRAKGERKVMEVSHMLVGGLTVASLCLLIWIEVRSRHEAHKRVAETRSDVTERPSAGTRVGEVLARAGSGTAFWPVARFEPGVLSCVLPVRSSAYRSTTNTNSRS